MDKEIRDSIERFVKGLVYAPPTMCTVDSVDIITRTCYCIPKNGDADFKNVKLMARNSQGFLIIPKVGSDVVVSFLDSSTGFVSMFSTVETIMLNGDNFGGLIKLEDWITDVNNRFALFKTALNTAFTATDTGITSAGGTGTSSASWTAAIATDQPFIKNTYENTSVVHGKT